MLFDSLLHELGGETATIEYLVGHGEIPLLTRAQQTATQFEETLSEYALGAVRRYANLAGNDEWLALMTALGASNDPGGACLIHILNWALARDAAELSHGTGCCGHEPSCGAA